MVGKQKIYLIPNPHMSIKMSDYRNGLKMKIEK